MSQWTIFELCRNTFCHPDSARGTPEPHGRSFLWKLYGYTFLMQFIFIYPVYPLLFQSKGMSALQIGTLFAIWSSTTIALEVPTGMLADKFSRRTILALAPLIKSLAFTLWLFSDSFVEFAAGFVLWGLASSLTSGTFEAFVYDELKEMKQEKLFEKISGHARGFHFAGMTLGVLFGGFATEFGFSYALIPSICVPIIATFLILAVRPAPRTRTTEEARYWNILLDALRETRRNPLLLELILFISVAFGASGASDEFWSLWLEEIHFSFAMIGVVLAFGNAISSFASFLAHRLPLPGKRLHAFLLLGGLLVLLLAQINTQPAVLLVIPLIFIIEAAKVKYEARLQHAISSRQRATVSSINMLLLEIVALVFYFGMGMLADTLGYVAFLWLLSGALIVVSVAALLWTERKPSME